MFKLRLKNFRSFLDEEFDFSRINILIGENSAGKSSVLKFLLAIKQSLFSQDRSNYNLLFFGDEVDLGNYTEVIYKHETERNLGFEFEFLTNYNSFCKSYFTYVDNQFILTANGPNLIGNFYEHYSEVLETYIGDGRDCPTIISVELNSDLSKHENIKLLLKNSNLGEISFVFNVLDVHNPKFKLSYSTKVFSIVFYSKSLNQEIQLLNMSYQKQGFLSKINIPDLREKINEYHKFYNQDELAKIYWQIRYLLLTQDYLEYLIEKIDYINPILNPNNERIYLKRDKKDVGIIRTISDIINFSTLLEDANFLKDLVSALSNIGILDDIEILNETHTDELRVVLNKLSSNLLDVGDGVSLQIRIFAQVLLAHNSYDKFDGRGRIEMIEQPEARLHPNLQAKFIDSILKIGIFNIYFIETHSEHIIRMLQILVKSKDNDLKSEDVSIHYLKKIEDITMKSFHTINSETGKLTPNFPKGFYDVSYDLAFRLLD